MYLPSVYTSTFIYTVHILHERVRWREIHGGTQLNIYMYIYIPYIYICNHTYYIILYFDLSVHYGYMLMFVPHIDSIIFHYWHIHNLWAKTGWTWTPIGCQGASCSSPLSIPHFVEEAGIAARSKHNSNIEVSPLDLRLVECSQGYAPFFGYSHVWKVDHVDYVIQIRCCLHHMIQATRTPELHEMYHDISLGLGHLTDLWSNP